MKKYQFHKKARRDGAAFCISSAHVGLVVTCFFALFIAICASVIVSYMIAPAHIASASVDPDPYLPLNPTITTDKVYQYYVVSGFSSGNTSGNTSIYVMFTNSPIAPSLSSTDWVSCTYFLKSSTTALTFMASANSYPRYQINSSGRLRKIISTTQYTDYQYAYFKFSTDNPNNVNQVVIDEISAHCTSYYGTENGTIGVSKYQIFGGQSIDDNLVPILSEGVYTQNSIYVNYGNGALPTDMSPIGIRLATYINGTFSFTNIIYANSQVPGRFNATFAPYFLLNTNSYSADDYIFVYVLYNTGLSLPTDILYIHDVLDSSTADGLNEVAQIWAYQGYQEAITDAQEYNFATMAFAILETPVKVLIGEYDDVQHKYVGGMLNFNIFGYNLRDIFLVLVTLGVFLYLIHTFIGLRGGSNG